MSFKMINENFNCENCSKKIKKNKKWWVRNHCNFCLYSKHLDKNFPWDRLSDCLWIMKPIWIEFKKNKWNMIKHKCKKCNQQILNKISYDDKFLEFIKKINKIY